MNGRFSNVKKVLATLICAFMLIQCAALGVFAADIAPEAVVFERPEVLEIVANQIGKNYVYVDITTQGGGNDQPVMAYLTDASGNLVTMGYAPIDTDTAEIKLGVPDSAATGEYTIAVALNKAADVATSSVYYIGVGDVDGLFEAVNATEGEVTEKIDAHYEALSVVESTKDVKLTGESYELLSDNGKAEFAELILNGVNGKYSNGKGEYDAKNAEDFVKEAYVLAAYNAGGLDDDELSELVYSYDETIGFNSEDENLYGKIENRDTLVKVAKTMTEKAQNAEELATTLEQAVCVQIVNETYWLNLVKIVSDNNSLFGVDEDQVSKLLKNKTLRKAFCKEFQGTYYSVEEIQEAWEDAYAVAKKASSGGSGGSGGSSKKETTIVTHVVSSQITNAENNYDPNVEILDYYTDMGDYMWTSEAVLNLTQKGIVSGYGDKTFAPEKSLTRAEFTKMLVNTFGLADITATCSFTDVESDAWYYIYIASAEKYGLAQGYGNGLFGVNNPVTRQDAVTLIYRAAKAKGISVAHFNKSASGLKDRDEIAEYAYPAVEALYNTGVYLDASDPKSVNVFEPTRYATRGYVCVLLNQLYMYMN